MSLLIYFRQYEIYNQLALLPVEAPPVASVDVTNPLGKKTESVPIILYVLTPPDDGTVTEKGVLSFSIKTLSS